MTATNQQMTSQQLDELMVVAVSMQRDAEKLDERPVAVFAYAVQLALAELQQAKQQVLELSVKLANVESKCAVLAVENDRAVKAVTVFSNVTHDITEIICDELGQERVAEIVAAYNDLGNMLATYAYLAEVRA
ncbi:TPA: hypothetical protein JAV82_004361, partial [Kluyvera ascorbata]|nr:hypothetical protein [Kluyvera ascorbata]